MAQPGTTPPIPPYPSTHNTLQSQAQAATDSGMLQKGPDPKTREIFRKKNRVALRLACERLLQEYSGGIIGQVNLPLVTVAQTLRCLLIAEDAPYLKPEEITALDQALDIND